MVVSEIICGEEVVNHQFLNHRLFKAQSHRDFTSFSPLAFQIEPIGDVRSLNLIGMNIFWKDFSHGSWKTKAVVFRREEKCTKLPPSSDIWAALSHSSLSVFTVKKLNAEAEREAGKCKRKIGKSRNGILLGYVSFISCSRFFSLLFSLSPFFVRLCMNVVIAWHCNKRVWCLKQNYTGKLWRSVDLSLSLSLVCICMR